MLRKVKLDDSVVESTFVILGHLPNCFVSCLVVVEAWLVELAALLRRQTLREAQSLHLFHSGRPSCQPIDANKQQL